MLQPTNTAQASVSDSLITATAAPAFTALGSPHASSTLSGAQSALRLQGDVKAEVGKLVESGKTATAAPSAVAATPMRSISELKAKIQSLTSLENRSEVDLLVEFGKTSGTTHFNHGEIQLLLTVKIHALRESAKDSHRLPSVRADLCKLSRVSELYYNDLKEEIFDLLIARIQDDPVAIHTAIGVLQLVIDLSADMSLSKVQVLTVTLQIKLAKAFSAAVELYLCHYNMKDHVNAVTEDQKRALLETQNGFDSLNTQENTTLEFAIKTAIEASKRLTSDSTVFGEVFQRLAHFSIAIGQAYAIDVATVISELGKAFDGLDAKFKDKWFDALFMLRGLVQKAPNTTHKVIAVQKLLATQKTCDDWKLIYGAFEILHNVVSQIQNKETEVLETILFGQAATGIDTATAEALGLAKEVAALSAVAAQSIVPRLPGIIDFVEYNGYVTKALVTTKSDNKADSVIKAKAKDLCTLVLDKLSKTYKGRKIMLEHYRAARSKPSGKAVVAILDKIIPVDSKMQKDWLKPTDSGRSIPHSILLNIQQYGKTHHLTTVTTHATATAEKIAESIMLQQKQQVDEQKASTTTVESAVAQGKVDSAIKNKAIDGVGVAILEDMIIPDLKSLSVNSSTKPPKLKVTSIFQNRSNIDMAKVFSILSAGKEARK